MGFVQRAIASFFSQLVKLLPTSLTSKWKIPPKMKPADNAAPNASNGNSPPSIPDDTLIRVPIYKVQFGGDVEGETYIPVHAPLKVRREISSPFGVRRDPLTGEKKEHKGIDLECPVGDEVRPPEDGVVLTAGYNTDGDGRRVVVAHYGRKYQFCTAYFHLSRILVKVGDKVTGDTVLGLTGGDPSDPESGKTTGPHLHFETRRQPGYVPKRPVLDWTRATA